MINPIIWAYDKLDEGAEYLADNWSAVFDDWEDFMDSFNSVAQESFSAFFEFLSSSLGFLNNFIFDFIFEDLFGSCRFYGTQILNYFFDTFANKPFDFVAIEAVVGFSFVVFAFRLIVNIIRG